MSTSKELAIPGQGLEGLEDISPTDLTMPIWRIDHEEGHFVNGLSGETYDTFEAVFLGVIKQRILWPQEPGSSGEQPMCRSVDYEIGLPDLSKWTAKQKDGRTAQKASGFTLEQVEEGDLPCGQCNLKEWGKQKQSPWCNEQWTMPFVRFTDQGVPIVSVISFVRTGLKPCRNYVSSFVQANTPLYTAVTKVKAVVTERGTVSWVVPSFSRIQESDPTQWETFSKMLGEVKPYLTTPRAAPADDDEIAVQQATAATATVSRPAPTQAPTAPAAQTTAASSGQVAEPPSRAQPAAPPAAAGNADDEEEPF